MCLVPAHNGVELLDRTSEMRTDFAVAEECNRYDECGAYQNVYGRRGFVIEYRREDFDNGCSDFRICRSCFESGR